MAVNAECKSGMQTIEERCIGCRICEKNCPAEAIKVVEKKAKVDPSACISCGMCAEKCPKNALYLPGSELFSTSVLDAVKKQEQLPGMSFQNFVRTWSWSTSRSRSKPSGTARPAAARRASSSAR